MRLLLIFIVSSSVLMGCTHVPFNYPKSTTFGVSPSAQSLVYQETRQIAEGRGGKSAMVPLLDGNDALGARLRLIEAAETSIDAQYFLIKPDAAGDLFALALIDAAQRGVRVRLLVDDVFTTAKDQELAFLDSYENLEVRVFNPLSRNSAKLMNFVLDFQRVNRRMHNKSLTIDNSMSIVGGRNIADEYYQIDTNAEFADLDFFFSGPVTKEITRTFDQFWNDPFSIPIAAFADVEEHAKKPVRRAEIEERARAATENLYKRAVNSSYLNDIYADQIKPSFAYVKVVTDDPDKLRTPVPKAERAVADALMKAMNSSTKEVAIISPYFVPRKEGTEFLISLINRGVRVRIITNSLASTNHKYVHGGYSPYRKTLLKAGAEIYEVRADAPEVLGEVPPGSSTRLTMHSKAVLFDRRRMFIGSLNFDPRSIEINTELGLFIGDSDLVSEMASLVDNDLVDYAYKLTLDDRDQIVWSYSGAKRNEKRYSEPSAGIMAKVISRLARILPIEGQL